jgi:two-component system sensor histidine kinase KdpD
VGNLLDITRLEAGTLDFKREMVDLAELVETALRRAARILARHRIKVDLAAELPMVKVDVALFEQALFNLLDNAAKYAPQSSLIGIRAEFNASEVMIVVEDEGPGIPPDQLERIFDKFHRASEGDNRPAGTGLGLSICRGFIEGLGGRITAANRDDRSGARFTIVLPIEIDAIPRDLRNHVV